LGKGKPQQGSILARIETPRKAVRFEGAGVTDEEM